MTTTGHVRAKTRKQNKLKLTVVNKLRAFTGLKNKVKTKTKNFHMMLQTSQTMFFTQHLLVSNLSF